MELARELHEWAHSNGGRSPPEMHDEARRRWGHLTSLKISQIIIRALKLQPEEVEG